MCQSGHRGSKSPFICFQAPLQCIGYLTTRNIFSGDVEGELCEETGVDIVGALDIIGEVNFFLSFQLRLSVLEVNFFLDFPLRRFSYIMYATTEDVVDLQVCGDDAAKDFSEKELVDRWATAIQTKR